MLIPKLHYISQGQTPQEHLSNINKACTHGVGLVQLRLKNYTEDIILETAQKAREITARYQTQLIINDHYKIAKAVEANGVHLGKTDECPKKARNYLGKQYLIGGTANTVEDCNDLISKHVDYIGLGPFKFTQTKTNLSPVLGLDGYRSIIGSLKNPPPIIAIGGIVQNDINKLLNTGVHGIAMSAYITQHFNNIPTLNQLIIGLPT